MGKARKMGGKTGTSLGSFEESDERTKRIKRAMRRQEARWAARSGPVTVRKIGDPPPASGG